jgi:hypothetical protein
MTSARPALSREDACELTDALHQGLRGRGRSHYEALDAADLAQRCSRLVDAFLTSLEGEAGAFVDYVRRITEERIAEGFYLPEIQMALSLLEARAWHIVVDRSSIGALVGHLSVVTGTIGAAKDELARVYLAHKQRAEADLARLQTSRLFAGTEGCPEIEPEPLPAGGC